MIEAALSHVALELDRHLKRKLGESEGRVVLSPLFEQDGTVTARIDNKLLMFVVNIEKDSVARGNGSRDSELTQRGSTRPLHLNLHVLVAANFANGNYAEALRFISDAASFFQRQPVMTSTNSPDLDPRIQRLTLDIENLSISQLSNLWSILGGRYLPSILYKIRMITLESADVLREVQPIREPATTVSTRSGTAE
ncbi:DUF4255 domain-containing protein [Granulosicoccus sp. 3-233]|uniref:DUF4255 domain-containing protein n=1 Tax=Granulosicoccus sp. 3-233 TaxID=3417969 RepID=UPI003D334FA9